MIGLHAWFFSFHFVLLVANVAAGTGFGSYRTAGLKVDGCNKRIAFKWKNGSEDAEITLGRCPLVATGSSKSRTLPESRLPVADQRKLSNAGIVRMREALAFFRRSWAV